MKKSARRYEYKLTLGKDFTGKYQRKSFYSCKSKSDAKKKAEAWKLEHEMELFLTGEAPIKRMKFEVWAKECMETYKKSEVKNITYEGTYLTPLKKRLIPHFGEHYLDEIKPLDIQNYINEAKKQYAPETIAKDFHVLGIVFRTAVDNDFIKKSPITKSITLPKRKPVKEKKVFSQEEYEKAYQFAVSDEKWISVLFMMELGVSRSELLGIQWKDINETAHTVGIRRGVTAFHNSDIGKEVLSTDGLKNKFRNRELPIVNNELWEKIMKMPRTKTVNGQVVALEYVFSSPDGHVYNPNNWSSRVFKPFMSALCETYPEIPKLSPHELRHSRSTLWIEEGVNPYHVASLLGHSGLSMLKRVYDHTNAETLRNALISAKE